MKQDRRGGPVVILLMSVLVPCPQRLAYLHPARRSVTERAEQKYLVFTRDAGGPFGARLGELVLGYCDGDIPFV